LIEHAIFNVPMQDVLDLEKLGVNERQSKIIIF